MWLHYEIKLLIELIEHYEFHLLTWIKNISCYDDLLLFLLFDYFDEMKFFIHGMNYFKSI